jgi:hypothetical protein
MGQVINFSRRPTRSAETTHGVAAVSPRPLMMPPIYPQAMLVHHMALWRSLMASYAGLWFAPFGIEVKVIEKGEKPTPKVRASSGGG